MDRAVSVNFGLGRTIRFSAQRTVVHFLEPFDQSLELGLPKCTIFRNERVLKIFERDKQNVSKYE